MNDLFLKPEQYKELDELMTYILDEMWGTDDKKMVREGIIAYTNRWHELQVNAAEQSKSKCNKHDVNGSNSEITWALLENKDFENSFAMERLGINKNTIISMESDPEGDDNYKMVYYWR